MRHPDWLHKKMLEKNDILKQRKINEFFKSAPKNFTVPSEIFENTDKIISINKKKRLISWLASLVCVTAILMSFKFDWLLRQPSSDCSAFSFKIQRLFN